MDEQQQAQLIEVGNQVISAAQQGNENAQAIVQKAQEALQDENVQQQVMAMAQSSQEQEQQMGMAIIGTAMVLEDNMQQEQQVPQNMAQQAQPTYMAKRGAKLNYLKSLKNICPEGYETAYFQRGGQLIKGCKKCQQKAAKAQEGRKMNAIEEFKCGKKMKKKK